MQENKLISTIESLYSLGQLSAIEALANDLKDAYDYALTKLKRVEHSKQYQKSDKNVEKTKSVISSNTYNDYDSSWRLIHKFQYILKTESRFLHFREVAKIILELEGLKNTYEKQKELARKLSGNISIRKLKQNGNIVLKQHNNSPKKSFWGSKKWIDTKGNILPAYKYSLDITKTGKQKIIKQSIDKSLFDI